MSDASHVFNSHSTKPKVVKMNKYIISVITALTMFSASAALAEPFHNPDGTPGCISQEELVSRFESMKKVFPEAIMSPADPTEEGMGKKVLAAINTVLKDEGKDQINGALLETIKTDVGTFVMFGDDGKQWCSYLKLDNDEFAKVIMVLKTYEASQLDLGPTL